MQAESKRVVLAAVAAALCLLPALALAQSSPPPAPPAGATAPAPAGGAMSPADMQQMMKLASPGEHHKRLGNFVGRWATHTKMWMAPGQPPAENDGTMEATWILGGRYVVAHHKGMFMGMPFEGESLDGYDNMSKKYVQSWVDNMGTGILNLTGTCDSDDCKVLTESGELVDPVSGQKGIYKAVTTFVGPDSFKYEAYFVDGKGASMKMLEVTATRSK